MCLCKKIVSTAVAVVATAGVALAAGNSPWSGKKVSILGDSYSTWRGVSTDPDNTYDPDGAYYPLTGQALAEARSDVDQKSQMWWSKALASLGGTLLQNRSYGGSGITWDVGETMGREKDGKQLVRSFEHRAENGGLKKDGASPDVILVYGGTNDSWDGAPTNTYEAAVGSLFGMLKKDYPNAAVYVVVNKLKAKWNGSLAAYRQPLFIAAVTNGFKVIDLEGFFATDSDTGVMDGYGHPMASGMAQIANRVVSVVSATPCATHKWVTDLEAVAPTPERPGRTACRHCPDCGLTEGGAPIPYEPPQPPVGGPELTVVETSDGFKVSGNAAAVGRYVFLAWGGYGSGDPDDPRAWANCERIGQLKAGESLSVAAKAGVQRFFLLESQSVCTRLASLSAAITASSGSYFETDYKPNANTEFFADFTTPPARSYNEALACARSATGAADNMLQVFYNGGTKNVHVAFPYPGSWKNLFAVAVQTHVQLTCKAGSAVLSNLVAKTSTAQALDAGTFADAPVYLLAMTSDGGKSFANYCGMPVHELKFSESGVAKHDYVPVKVKEDGKVTFLDLVTGEVLTAKGAAQFTAGAELGVAGFCAKSDLYERQGPAHEHTMGAWRETKAPALGVAGEKQRACTGCGFVVTNAVPAIVDVYAGRTPFALEKTILCLGDSITYGEKADAIEVKDAPNYFDGRLNGLVGCPASYPYRLAAMISKEYNVIAQAKSGKCTDAIMSWVGGVPLRLAKALTVPAAGQTATVGIDGNPLYNGTDPGLQYAKRGYDKAYYGMLTPVYPLIEANGAGTVDSLTGWLGGVHVRFAGNHADERTVCRIDGVVEAAEIPVGSTFVPDAAVTYRAAVKVVFSGTNDGAENYLAVLSQIEDGVTNAPNAKFVVISSWGQVTQAGESVDQATPTRIEQEFARRFGVHYLNGRLAMKTNGLARAVSLGLMTAEQAAQRTWHDTTGDALFASGDGTHLSTRGYEVLASFVKDKLQSLGYVPPDEPSESWEEPTADTPAAVAESLAKNGFPQTVQDAITDRATFNAFRAYCENTLKISDPKTTEGDVKKNALLYYALDAQSVPETLTSEDVTFVAADLASATLVVKLDGVTPGAKANTEILEKIVDFTCALGLGSESPWMSLPAKVQGVDGEGRLTLVPNTQGLDAITLPALFMKARIKK